MLESISRAAATFVGREIILCIGIDQAVTLAASLSLGYEIDQSRSLTGDLYFLRKVAFAGAITPAKWELFSLSAQAATGVRLPAAMPSFRDVKRDGLNVLRKDGKSVFVDYLGFEGYLRPVLVLFPGRSGLMIPIKPAFAQDLLGAVSSQISFLPGHDASLKLERTYFRKPKNAGLIQAGMPIIFYASGDMGVAIGCARVTSSVIKNIEEIGWQIIAQGVLDVRQLREQSDSKGMLQVITFEAFQPFHTNVGIKQLRDVKADKGNFITVQKLSPQQVREICEMGFQENPHP